MKFKKTLLVFCLIICVLFCVSSVAAGDVNDAAIASENQNVIENQDPVAASEATTGVDNEKIESDVISSSSEEILKEKDNGTFTALQEKINNAEENATITLENDYVYDNGFSSKGITISKKMTIDGKGHTLDAGLKSRIFNIAADKVTLKNIVFKNGNFNKGGAVYFNGAGEITNCNFTNNRATSSGGYSYGGAVYFRVEGTVINCNFIDNYATGSDPLGGAIFFYSYSKGNVTNCNFTNNTATWGGAIYFISGGSNVTNCNFINNNAYNGGAIKMGSGNVTNCTFTNNTADDGGAVYFNSNGTVTNCNFTNNQATNDGGAVFFYKDGTVTNCNFINNNAYFGGGAIRMKSGTVSNCNFTANTATYDGCGAIRMGSGNVTNCNFINNNAYYGGAVYFFSGGSNVTNCTFTNNTATYDGGAIYFYKDGTVTNCNFTNNRATSSGGAIYFNELSSVNKCIFNGNSDPEIYPIPEPISNTTENSTTVPEINIPSLDEPSADGTVTVTLPADATGTLTLTVGGKDYNFDVIEGKANVKLPDLGDGDYPYTITYSGDSKYSSFTTDGSLKVNKTNANPVENQTNSTVNPIDNKTDNNTTENNTSQENTTVIDNSKIVASNVNVVYSSGSYYTIKVYGKDGKLADGANVKVSGKISKTLTTTNGVAKFKIDQVPGTYKITISALGKSVTKTITVKHIVTLKTATLKKSAKKLILQATLAKVNKKYLKNKQIIFKFNGKKYKAKTNKKGVAKVTIKKSILKKLKAGKKITYQATYLKDTIKKTAKVKK